MTHALSLGRLRSQPALFPRSVNRSFEGRKLTGGDLELEHLVQLDIRSVLGLWDDEVHDDDEHQRCRAVEEHRRGDTEHRRSQHQRGAVSRDKRQQCETQRAHVRRLGAKDGGGALGEE